MVCTAQVGELGRERDWNTYMYMCTIYIFSHAHYMYTVHCTAQVRELGRERERETGMPPWAGPGTWRETRAGFLVHLDSEL